MSFENRIKKGEGLIVVEVINSNPNGDPDNGGAPRVYSHDNRGWISDVSFARKIRNIIMEKNGAWKELVKLMKLDESRFNILEDPSRGNVSDIAKWIDENGVDAFHDKYYDARIRGNTLLEETKDDDEKQDKSKKGKLETMKRPSKNAVRTGVIVFGNGVSVAPVKVLTPATCTKMAAVQDGKSRGMAPQRIKNIEHGLYCIPFFVNPCAAEKTRCTQEDVEVMLKLIPEAYSHCASTARPNVRVVKAYYVEFNSLLGVGNIQVSNSLRPIKKGDLDTPSTSISDYDFPGMDNDLLTKIEKKISRKIDLCE